MTQQPLNLHQKLVEIRRNIGRIEKDSQSYNYTYVSGSQVLSKIQDSMNTLGVLLIPEIKNQQFEKHEYRNNKGKDAYEFLVHGEMTYTWINADNPEDKLTVPFYYNGAQEDFSKAFGSALTYSERYFIIKFFNLPTDSDDPDARNNGYNNQQQYQQHQQPNYQQAPPQRQNQQQQNQNRNQNQNHRQQQPATQQPPQYEHGTNNNLITSQQLKALKTAINQAATRAKTDKIAIADYAKMKLDIPAELESKLLTRAQATQLIGFINAIPPAQSA